MLITLILYFVLRGIKSVVLFVEIAETREAVTCAGVFMGVASPQRLVDSSVNRVINLNLNIDININTNATSPVRQKPMKSSCFLPNVSHRILVNHTAILGLVSHPR